MSSTQQGTELCQVESHVGNYERGSSPHGSHAGLKRHARAGEPPCEDCRAFRRSYMRDYYAVRASIEAIRRADNAKAAARMSRRRAADPDGWRRRQRAYAKRRREAARHDAHRLVDPVVVARLIDGERVRANRPERLEAVRQLRARGYAYQQIADRLHVAQRQVHRDLADLGLTNTDHQEVSA